MNLLPKLVTRHSQKELKIIWNDGKESIYKLRELRAACLCALCKHEITRESLIKLEDISEDINVIKIETVGNYALHFAWSDGHSTGIYSYEHLREVSNGTPQNKD